jgi:hypothetical protein
MPHPTPDAADRTAEGLADLIEVGVLARGVTGLSAAEARELLAEVAGAANESADMALNVMQRRERLLGGRYPFRVSAVGVRLARNTHDLPYTSLLLMSSRASPFRTAAGGLADAATILESLTCAAVRGLLGGPARAVRFGWPSEHGRPREFPDAVRWLASQMGLRVGSSYRSPRRQDGGVDVVGWRPFGDGQPGFPILLVQCTLERDFVHKSGDVDLRVWSGWLAFDTDPLTALAIPYTVSSAEDWKEMATRVIVLDRLRLASLIAADAPELSRSAPWTADQFEQMRSSS